MNRPMNFVRLGEVAELLEVEMAELATAIAKTPPKIAARFADFVYEKREDTDAK